MSIVLAVTLGLFGTPLELEWAAPDTCPTATAIEARVRDAVGETQGPPLRAAARITAPTQGSFTVELTLSQDDAPPARRTLSGATCAEVSDAAVLILVIAIDPEAAAALPQPSSSDPGSVPTPPLDPTPLEPAASEPTSPKPGPSAVPAPAPPDETDPGSGPPPPKRTDEPARVPPANPETDPPPARNRPSRPKPGVDLLAAGGVGFGILPTVTGTVGVQAALLGARWRIELGGTYETPTSSSAPTRPELGARAQLWSVEARGCGTLGRSAISVPLCGGVRAGLLHAEGTGALETTDRAASPWIALSVAPTVLWRPAFANARLLLGARAEASVSLTRPGFSTAQGSTILEGGAVGGQFTALIGYAVRPR